MKILIISGWGGVISLLQPLQQYLEREGHQVTLIDYFLQDEVSAYIEIAQNYDVLIGWSLGGQLATLLAYCVQQQGQQKILITLMSNPCFVVNEHWNCAMSVDNFNTFQQGFIAQPLNTLKRFSHLIAQGEVQAKSLALQIQHAQQNYINSQSQNIMIDKLKQGLDTLQQLNTLNDLKQLNEIYQIPQYHFFAQHDVLVPIAVSDMLSHYLGDDCIIRLENCGHGAVVSQVEYITQRIYTLWSCIKNPLNS